MSDRREVLKNFERYREQTQHRVQHGIEQNRKGHGIITVTDAKGVPIQGAKLRLKQKNHEFRFGANLFMLDEFESEQKNTAYRDAFASLFNMATLPFYWDSTEPEKGKLRYRKMRRAFTADLPLIFVWNIARKWELNPGNTP